MELKPAHQVITKRIAAFVETIKGLDKMINDGGVNINRGTTRISPSELYATKLQQIGGLCGLLDVLREMFVPLDALDDVIGGLKKLEHHHAAISGTIGYLKQRLGVPVKTP